MSTIIRPYDRSTDLDACLRIWRETGWFDGSEAQRTKIEALIDSARANVAELAGEAECLVLTRPGSLRYLEEDLPIAIVADVTTSRVGRKQGLASRTTALAVAQEAAAGAPASALGMFEQGYYDRLGFGSGRYEILLAFDPAELAVNVRCRVPRRLTSDDVEAMHAARLARLRRHGAISLLQVAATQADLGFARNGFGLGYYDGPDGSLSHCFWCTAENVGHGPYSVNWLAYRTREQLLELLAVLKSLGDQVHLVRMFEPPGTQLQDLILKPQKQRRVTRRGEFEAGGRIEAWWQMRICDLAACLARTHLAAGSLRFNLHLSDPIGKYLPEDAAWRGVAGDYVVTLGPDSAAEPGMAAGLPTLVATVGAFTRLWIGVCPASGLAFTDNLAGPPELLAELDRVLALPVPLPDWRF